MEVLVHGWSDIAERRVVPALLRTATVSAVHVASDFITEDVALSCGVSSISSSENAYVRTPRRSSVDMVYVTGHNALHGERATSAIRRGIPTIIDKPAFTSTADAETALQLASTSAVFLDEALVWTHHPQVVLLAERLAAHSATPEHAEVLFTIPGPSPGNFRWCRDKGGGALLDMGPYLMSAARRFLGGEPTEISCKAERSTANSVVRAATMSIRMSTGGTLCGYIGFGSAYANRITLLGPGLRAQLEPAFSGPTDLPRSVQLEIKGMDASFTTPAADPFQSYFQHAFAELAAGAVGPSARIVMSIDDLRQAELATTFANALDSTGGRA